MSKQQHTVISPEIEELMEIPLLDAIPDKFEGYLSESQLREFPITDHPFLLTASRTEQKVDWMMNQMTRLAEGARKTEARQIRTYLALRNKLRWTMGATFCAFAGALATWIFKKL